MNGSGSIRQICPFKVIGNNSLLRELKGKRGSSKHWMDKSRKKSVFGLYPLLIIISMNQKSFHFKAMDLCL